MTPHATREPVVLLVDVRALRRARHHERDRQRDGRARARPGRTRSSTGTPRASLLRGAGANAPAVILGLTSVLPLRRPRPHRRADRASRSRTRSSACSCPPGCRRSRTCPDSSGYAKYCVVTDDELEREVRRVLVADRVDLAGSVARNDLGPVGLIGPCGMSLGSSSATSVRDVLRHVLDHDLGAGGRGHHRARERFAEQVPPTCGGDAGFSSPSSTTIICVVGVTARTGASGFSIRSRKPLVPPRTLRRRAASSSLPTTRAGAARRSETRSRTSSARRSMPMRS